MISLETFKNLMNAIEQQEQIDDKLTDILVCKDSNGWISSADTLVNVVFESLEKELNDEYEYLSWWKYDISDGDKYIYMEKEGIKYNLNSLDDLYYYVIGEYDKVKTEKYPEEEIKEKHSNTYYKSTDEVIDLVKEMWEKK